MDYFVPTKKMKIKCHSICFESYFAITVQVCGPPGMMKHISGEKAKDYSQGEVCKKFALFQLL